MFAPIAVQDVSWPDPQFGGPDAILKWLECSRAYVNIPTSTTDDVSEVGPNFGVARYKWGGSAMAKNGLIAAAPFLNNARVLWINTNTDYVATGSVAVTADYTQTLYCAYDDTFYMFGRDGAGLLKIPANNTGSYTTISSDRYLAGWVNQNIIYFARFNGSVINDTFMSYDVTNNTFTTISPITATGTDEHAYQLFLAPNNRMYFPNNGGAAIQYYDFNTSTTGSISGTAPIYKLNQFSLMPDGNYYCPPGFDGDTVYKIDPKLDTLTAPFSGSPYNAGGTQRWMAWFPNNTISDLQTTTTGDVVAYDWETNTATSLNFTIPFAGGGDYGYFSSVLAKDGTYAIPADESHVVKFNKVDLRNLLNGATFSSPINTAT